MYPVCTSIQIHLPSKHALIIFLRSRTAEQLRTYASLADLMTDLSRADSQEPTESSVQRAYQYNPNLTFWGFLELPENVFRSRRFNCAMQGISSMQPPATILASTCLLLGVLNLLIEC